MNQQNLRPLQEQSLLKQQYDFKEELERNHIFIVLKDGDKKTDKNSLALNQQLYIHEQGSPINNLPPRPVVHIGLEEGREEINVFLQQGIELARRGRKMESEQAFMEAGERAVACVKRTFGGSELAPFKKKTFKQKKGLINAPLIDTGALRDAVTYEIRREGEEK